MRSTEDLEEMVRHATDPRQRGAALFDHAEHLKTLGDAGTQRDYEAAIGEQPGNPAYELHYADYLRNFRGPKQPLFPAAEQHYFRALAKLRRAQDLKPAQRRCLEARILRGLAALYERDGLPVAYWEFLRFLEEPDENRPLAFFSTQNRYGRSLDEFDQADAVRDLTVGALFAGSNQRLRRPLADAELRSFIEPRSQVETFDRLRVRYRGLPSLDLFYAYDDANHAQTTRFDRPGQFNSVDVTRYGIGLERTFDVYPLFDFSLRTEYARGERRGLVESDAHAKEDIESIAAAGVFSRFVGPDKVNLEIRYSFQDFDQRIKAPKDRSLEIVAVTFGYQRFTTEQYANLFNIRASEVFVGLALGEERFGAVHQNRDDYFIGAAARGLGWLGSSEGQGRLDIILQPTLYTANRTGREDNGSRAASLNNAQYRTATTFLYRIKDYENRATLEELPAVGPFRLSFLNLVFPLAHDTALHGPDSYEDFSAGVEVAAKLLAAAQARRSFFGATLLASAGYTYNRFYRLGKDEHLFGLSARLGF
ncbi:MAG: hypothetical protein HY699_03835 [Deltaproteobacteria bacterium]|nr:hypothetical protein [Deltaproteobacteria bacterium]